MTEFTPKWIAKAREQMKHISPLPWKACPCGKCGQIMNEHDCIAIATRGDWGDDYPDIRRISGSIEGKFEVFMNKIVYGHVPPETGNINAQYIAEACNNYPEALNHIERLQDLMLAYENDLVLLSVYGKLKRAEERIEELEGENSRLSVLLHNEMSQLELTIDLSNKRWTALNNIYTDGEKHNANWCKRKAQEGLGIK